MLDLAILTIGYLPIISYFQNELLGDYDEHIQNSHTSTLHAVYVCACYLSYIFWKSYRLLPLNLATGASIAFSLYDIPYYIKHFKHKTYYKYMIFHHLILIGASIGTYYCGKNYHISDPDYMNVVAMSFLSELSTPLLNYIQMYHGDVHILIKVFFTILYFLVRPVNLSYTTYYIVNKFGLFHGFTVLAVLITSLNCIWFVQILKKLRKHIQKND